MAAEVAPSTAQVVSGRRETYDLWAVAKRAYNPVRSSQPCEVEPMVSMRPLVLVEVIQRF